MAMVAKKVDQTVRELGEFLAVLRLSQRFLGATPASVDLIGGCLLGNGHVDVRQQIFAFAACLRRDGREIVVDFGIGHEQ